eukprot:g2635.t1
MLTSPLTSPDQTRRPRTLHRQERPRLREENISREYRKHHVFIVFSLGTSWKKQSCTPPAFTTGQHYELQRGLDPNSDVCNLTIGGKTVTANTSEVITVFQPVACLGSYELSRSSIPDGAQAAGWVMTSLKPLAHLESNVMTLRVVIFGMSQYQLFDAFY